MYSNLFITSRSQADKQISVYLLCLHVQVVLVMDVITRLQDKTYKTQRLSPHAAPSLQMHPRCVDLSLTSRLVTHMHAHTHTRTNTPAVNGFI